MTEEKKIHTETLDFQIIKHYIHPVTGEETFTLLDLRPEGMPPGYRIFDVTGEEFDILNMEFNIL